MNIRQAGKTLSQEQRVTYKGSLVFSVSYPADNKDGTCTVTLWHKDFNIAGERIEVDRDDNSFTVYSE